MAVEIAKKAYLPTVAAGFSQGLSLGNSSGLTIPGSISLTASLSLDLWNTKNSIDAASVAAAQADLNGSQGDSDLELSVVQALYAWLSSASAISSSAKALDYAESNYDNILEKFKLSSATTSDLSTAEALVSADKTALITARYGFLSNLSILFGLAGLEDETKLVALIP
jgi:outer membrane protein TolC